MSIFSLCGMIGLCLFCLIFLLTEFRKRADILILSSDHLEKFSFLGVGYAQRFDINEFDGFTKMWYYSKSYLHLIIDGKRVACCCNFHTRNYDTVKMALEDKLVFLGEENYSISNELSYILK
ncbi:hypothetical protein [Leeuwenhoekiella aestuarii]|nr:hypothetical protein [Leeuwenhoekiella aestuarii]